MFRTTTLILVFSALSLTQSGCHKSLQGNYRDAGGIFYVEFKPGGKALLKMSGDTQEADYTVEGDKVTLRSAVGTTVLTINTDGSLSGTAGLGTLRKAD